jgi:hypothetical protein
MKGTLGYLEKAKQRFEGLKGGTDGPFIIRNLNDLEYIRKMINNASNNGVSVEACLMYIDGAISDTNDWKRVGFKEGESHTYTSIMYSILYHKKKLIFRPLSRAILFGDEKKAEELRGELESIKNEMSKLPDLEKLVRD